MASLLGAARPTQTELPNLTDRSIDALTDHCELQNAIHCPRPTKVNPTAIISAVARPDRLDAKKGEWIAQIKGGSLLEDVRMQEMLSTLQRDRLAPIHGVDRTGDVISVPQHQRHAIVQGGCSDVARQRDLPVYHCLVRGIVCGRVKVRQVN